jgi:hypothetical protein
MRLINVHTPELKESFGADLSHYTLLSHFLENDEVKFQGSVRVGEGI